MRHETLDVVCFIDEANTSSSYQEIPDVIGVDLDCVSMLVTDIHHYPNSTLQLVVVSYVQAFQYKSGASLLLSNPHQDCWLCFSCVIIMCVMYSF
jgi:hypothetical protein